MRDHVKRPAAIQASLRVLAAFTAAAFLSGCSSSIDRFMSWRGKNPSDSDPVYTAALPKSKLTRKSVGAPALEDDQIASSPIKAAPQKRNSYTYASTRKPAKLKFNSDQNDVEPQVAESTVTREQAPEMQARSGKVRVEHGMTLFGIAEANDISVRKLARANGLRAPYRIQVGQVIKLPGVSNPQVPRATLASQKSQIEDTPRIASASRHSTGSHEVASGDTIYSLARTYGVSPAQIADANGLTMKSRLSLGQSLKIPGATASPIVAQNNNDEIVDSKPALVADAKSGVVDPAPTKVSEVPEIPKAVRLDGKQVAENTPGAIENPPVDGGMTLRWPVRGKVIGEFGKKPGGAKNEGVNIAVPEGTSVRAAEEGVVAYAGNELKGYGNLVLIRHQGGFVTAYAHAKELFVKKGDQVKRGDVIAKAGQTGAVDSPQLHFEVRKGATALDPLKFLVNSTAAN
jgi:murein DD-endopeptidase MepM/ murein hydrolase activator NlpD